MKTFLSRYLSAAQRFFFAFLALVAISNYSLAQDGPNTAPHIEQLKQVGASMNDAHEGARQTGCTLPVWHSGYPSRIFAMPRSARNFGFRVGDYIVSVNGQSMPRESEGLDDILGSIPGDGSVDVVIHRSGENMTVTAECADIAEFNRYYSGVIDAMLAGDGQACANAIGDLGNWAGVTTSQFGELRIMCLMAGDPTMSHWNAPEYLVWVAELMIDQSKYFPGAFNAEREKVNEIIQMLNMMGQEIRSDQLQQKLRKAEEFRETDSSPAFFE